MKLYYDDALQAAYMAREFNVVFAKRIKTFQGSSSLHYDSAVCMDITITPGRGRKWDKRLSLCTTPYYIRPESYDIFKPQVGDTIYLTVSHDINEENILEDWLDDEDIRIIQRNGKAFFMPKVLNE